MKKLMVGIVALSMLSTVLGVVIAAEGESKAKHSIKEVMANAHKGGLLKKVLADDATDKEKLVLLDHYISLVESRPPKGEMESWHNLAGKLALASAKVAVGREGATAELKAASNCAACHKPHK